MSRYGHLEDPEVTRFFAGHRRNQKELNRALARLTHYLEQKLKRKEHGKGKRQEKKGNAP